VIEPEATSDQSGATGKPWTQAEVDLTVAAYFEMWSMQFSGHHYRKTEFVRRLQTVMPVRNSRAIEAKFQNISAILAELGIGWIEGYRPLEHYQQILRTSVMSWLAGPSLVRETMETYQGTTLVAASPRRQATEDVLVPVPGSHAPAAKPRPR
jgi:hypothetical protein